VNPSVGRIVHYVARGSADGVYPAVCRVAIVTEVDSEDEVGLCVFNPTGLHFRSIAEGVNPHDEETKVGGTWHWPERVQ
jgi:hypothetical protein